MENILEIRNLDEYDYSIIKLSSPSMQSGNNYYTNITIGDMDKHLYIQFPKCTTKAGCVKNSTKSYTDLVFSASDTRIIKWLENFEIYLQNEIYKKRDLWFDTEISLDDIQELMTPIMRSYKSGKNILIRCNIKNHKCSVYDENEILLDLDNFTSEKEIIPLISVNGIKFSSKNFAIELNLSQIMILTSKDDLEKNCLIKSRISKKDNTFTNNTNVGNNLETLEGLELNNEIPDDKITENKDINTLETKTENINNDTLEKNDDKNILFDVSDKDIDDTINNNEKSVKNDNILDEIDLDNLDIEENDENSNSDNKDTLENNDKINIRDPEEIYYEIYKTALIKANTLKRNAIEAFLNAKNIKLKYNLKDLDLDIDDDLDVDLDDSLENISN